MKMRTNPVKMLAICLVFFLSGTGAMAAANPRERVTSYSMNSGRSGVLFDAAIYYGQSEATAEPALGNEWKNLTSVYDLKLGYVFNSNLYLGGEFSTRNDASATVTSNGTTAALGAGLFWGSGFNLRSFYRINESWGDYSNGTGFQADLGYMHNLTSNFFIGLLVSHRQTTFTKNNLIVGFKSFTKKETQPMLTLGFLIN